MFDGQIRSWSLLGLVVRPRPVIPIRPGRTKDRAEKGHEGSCFAFWNTSTTSSRPPAEKVGHTCFIEGLVTGH
jgi:hypothetical protein